MRAVVGKWNLALKTTEVALGLIFFIMLLDVIGMSILFPVAPYLVIRYGGDALTVTLLSVTYAAAQFFAAPILGKLGDRYGRRPVLLWSVFGSAVGYVIFGVGKALWVLFLARLIDGFTGGNMSTASAYIADVSTPDVRARNFTLVGMAWGLGLVLGPAMGAALGQFSLTAPAFAAAALSLLGILTGFFLLPESLSKERRETGRMRVHDLNSFLSIHHVARQPGLGGPLFTLCLFNFAFSGINSTEALFMIQKFAARPWQIGFMLVLVGLVLVTVQPVVMLVAPRQSAKRIAIACLLGQAGFVVGTFFVPLLWSFYLLTVLTRAGSGFLFPSLTALLSGRVSPGEQGLLMGVTTALTSMMNILGPLWAGVVYSHVMPGAPYWMGAMVYGIAALHLARSEAPEKGK